MSERRFEFTDAKSSKFWSIRRDGCAHTVQFGRIGTAGQTQTKEFATEAEAQRSYERLIDEKLRKGYVEVAEENDLGKAPSLPTSQTRTAPSTATLTGATGQSPRKSQSGSPIDGSSAAVPVSEALAAERALRLDPRDWFWATWRPLLPLPRPAAGAFSRDEALSRLARVTGEKYGWHWHWEKAEIAPSLTREEAHFWFLAMTCIGSRMTIADRVAHMAKQPCSGELSLDEVRKEIGVVLPWTSPEIMLPLASLLSLEELLELMLAPDLIPAHPRYQGYRYSAVPALLAGFRSYVLPYLGEAHRNAITTRVLPLVDPSAWPVGHYDIPPAQFHLAAYLGLGPDLQVLVSTWKDDHYSTEDWRDHYHRPQEIVFGLNDPTVVEAEMRRLQLRLKEPAYVRGWLAHTGYAALDWVAASIQPLASKDSAEQLLETFALVQAPEAAPHMLELMLLSKSPRVARQWLEAHPGHAIAGLVPVAADRGRTAEVAADFLRTLKRKGYEPEIRSRLTKEAPEIARRVDAAVLQCPEDQFPPFDDQTTPDWLREAATVSGGSKRANQPAWVDVADLPPVVLGQHRLNEAQIEALLFALRTSQLAEADAVLTMLKEKVDRPSLDSFFWRLFEQWLAEGAPSRENWAMKALGRLGSDAIALKLTPLIRQWPGESQHPRAVLGLECLRAIGTDTALMQINGIAQKIKFKGLKAKALECMEAIAKERGFTRAELEDRIVPDCDLDERGSRSFDFGARLFRMVLGPDLKPMIRDEAGKLRSDLPKPTTKDDAERATAAMAEWKLLKKQVAEVARIQAVRLEQAIVTGRRWSRDAFETLLVRHPLMTTLVRRLVWCGYDRAGTLVATFRVTEDATCADVQDNSFDLAGITQVGIVHPLHLTPEQRSAWGELLSDYEIAPPFPQLGRPTYRLEPGEAEKTEITRFASVKIPAVSLVGTLERLDWARGIPEDGGCFHEHSKAFYGANVSAIIEYEGVPVGYMVDWDDQKIDRCYFIPGLYRPEIYPKHPEPLPLGQVDPVVISEVLADLSTLASKGK